MTGDQRMFAITIAYKGTRYGGWQVQPNAPTIQACLEKGVYQATGEQVRVTGSGRTDAGVHAIGQVGSFPLETWRAPASALIPAINQRLPDDIAIRRSREVPQDFHAIRDAIDKTYCYTIFNSRIPNPVRGEFHFRVARTLNREAMQVAAELFLGEHDFRTFETNGSPRKSTVRSVYSLEVTSNDVVDGREIQIRIRANGFLYNMVRNMVGALVEVGVGRRKSDWISYLLATSAPIQPGTSAPARGLCLEHVSYPAALLLDADCD